MALRPTMELRTGSELNTVRRTLLRLTAARRKAGLKPVFASVVASERPGYTLLRCELEPHELEPVLNALARVSAQQRANGEVPALAQTGSRYLREPKRRERWQTARETAERMEGDCEDLSIALCGDFLNRKVPARVRVKPVRPGLRHALVEARTPRLRRLLVDPSKARGMKGRG